MVNRIASSECPPTAQLRGLLDGTLPNETAEVVEGHVEECRRCQAALAALTCLDPYKGSDPPSSHPIFRPDPEFLTDLCNRLSVKPPPPPSTDTFPEVSGYEVIREIGHGGMGVVYLAHDLRLNRPVALKLVHVPHAKARERFKREAQAAARTHHPNIVQVYEVGEAAGRPFLALEYIDGPTLAQRFRGRPQPPKQAAELVEKLARAVHAAHQQGIIHRDLKPANILIAADDTPKVTDFGLAKVLDDESNAVTHTGQLLGTPGYVPPEQIAPAGKVAPATDVYALGAILYELLTGRPPFQAGRPLDTLLQVMYREPVSPGKLAPQVPRDLETICLTCLNKNPDRRYASAAALADDLARFLAGKPVRARPVRLFGRMVRWTRRNPTAAAFIGLLVCTALLAIGGLTSLWRQSVQMARVEADARHAAQYRAADLTIDRAQTMCEQSEVSRGLWELATITTELPANAGELERVARLNMGAWQHYIAPRRHSLEHPADVPAIAFSPDGKFLLTACADGIARLWDLTRGARIGPDLSHPGGVTSVAFAPDGRSAITAGKDGTAQLWKIPSGRALDSPLRQNSAITTVVFSPDGKSILTGAEDGIAQLWDAATGKPSSPAQKHGGPIAAAAFAPDGKSVLTGSTDRTALFWNATTGELIRHSMRHSKPVQAVAFAPNGQSFVTGSAAELIGTWPPERNGPTRPVTTFHWPAPAFAFDPKDRFLAVAHALGDMGTSGVTVIKPGDIMVANTLAFKGQHVRSLAVGPGGHCLLAGGGTYATLWLEPCDREHSIPLEHTTDVQLVAISPSGDRAATVTRPTNGKGSVVFIWTIPTTQDGGLTLTQPGVGFLSVGPSGRVFAAGKQLELAAGRDQSPTSRLPQVARMWDETTGQSVAPEWKYTGRVAAVSWSRDEGCCWLVNGAKVMRVNTATGIAFGDPLILPAEVANVAAAPDGKWVAIRDANSVIHVYSCDAAGMVHHSFEVTGAEPAFAFNPDGRSLFVADATGEVRAWETESGRTTGEPFHPHSTAAAIRFSPDGRRIAVACSDKSVSLWDAVTGKQIGLPLLHPDAIIDLTWSPDGTMLATVCSNGSPRFWDTTTGKQIGPAIPRKATTAVFGATNRLLMADGGNEVHSWRVPVAISIPINEIAVWVKSVTGKDNPTVGSRHYLHP